MLCKTPEETRLAGERLGVRLRGQSAVIALYGELGAGKTVFVQGLARGLGISEPVTSPTYTLVRSYPGFYHFDMYRLQGAGDLFDLGWEDLLQENAVYAVEWSERVEEALPPDAIHVRISYVQSDSNARLLEISEGER